MSHTRLTPPEPVPTPPENIWLVAQSQRLQEAYEARRAQWAMIVGRPYPGEPEDVRPAPGELDNTDV